MPMLPPLPELVTFEEVAAVLDEAVLLARGGPPYVIGAGGVASRGGAERGGLPRRPGARCATTYPLALLRLPIGELVTWQLVASCSGCRADRVLFVRELVERFGERPTLVMLVPRLRCREETWRRPPVRVMLRNREPAAVGGTGFVEVALV